MKNIFYVVAASQNWGRGFTPKDAEKNARLTPSTKFEYFLHILTLKPETTEEELQQLAPCWGVNDFGDLVRCNDITESDQALIDRTFIGWSVVHYNKPKVKS